MRGRLLWYVRRILRRGARGVDIYGKMRYT